MRPAFASWLIAVSLGACYDLDALDRDTDLQGVADDGGGATDSSTSTDALLEDVVTVDTSEPPLDAEVDANEIDDGGIDGTMPRNGGFEELGVGCGPGWSPQSTTPIRDPAARTGASACRLCAVNSTFFFISSVRAVGGDGGEWAAQAHFRSLIDGGPYKAMVSLRHTIDGGVEKRNSAEMTTTGWVPGVSTLRVPPGSGNLYLSVGGQDLPQGSSNCLLVDDVELTFTP